jgi:hypothetical protein
VSDQSYPVTVAVRRADGSVEQVRVGTAVRSGDGFRLTLGELSIGAAPDAARRPATASTPMPPPPADGGMVFPPYGRSKGAPIAGATRGDLEFYANGCKRSLNDPSKSRWHDKERQLLAAIEAEMARGGGNDDGYDQRPVAQPSRGGGGGGWGSTAAPPSYDDDAPPRSDDDIPF